MAGVWDPSGPLMAVTLLLGLAVVAGWLVLARRKYQLIRAEPTRCADLTYAARLPAAVMVAGSAEPGLGGRLTAPLSGRAAIWYLGEISTRVQHGRTVRVAVVWREVAPEPIQLRDGSGGVYVSPDVLGQTALGDPNASPPLTLVREVGRGITPEPSDTAEHAAERAAALAVLRRTGREDDARKIEQCTHRYTLREIAVLEGQRLVAVARPVRRDDGSVLLMPLRWGRHGVDTRTVGEVREKAREDTRTNLVIGGYLAAVLVVMLVCMLAQ